MALPVSPAERRKAGRRARPIRPHTLPDVDKRLTLERSRMMPPDASPTLPPPLGSEVVGVISLPRRLWRTPSPTRNVTQPRAAVNDRRSRRHRSIRWSSDSSAQIASVVARFASLGRSHHAPLKKISSTRQIQRNSGGGEHNDKSMRYNGLSRSSALRRAQAYLEKKRSRRILQATGMEFSRKPP